jgi:phasin family protein
VEKIVELNLSATKATLEEATAAAKQLAAAKDPQELLSLAAAQAQPGAEKATAYSRHLAGIVSSTQAEFTKAAEAQISETSRKLSALIDEISKNAPRVRASRLDPEGHPDQRQRCLRATVQELQASGRNAGSQPGQRDQTVHRCC